MKTVRSIPNAPHLVGIQDVRSLFCNYTGNATTARQTVSKWIVRRKIKTHGTNPKQRVFDRAKIIAALQSDFPQEPQFISVEDAFLMAHKAYPHARNIKSE